MSAEGAAIPTKYEIGPHIAIIGSHGRMGAMLMRKGRKAGYRMSGLDQPFTGSKMRSTLAGANLVIVCVPVRVFKNVLGQIIPYLPEDAVLSDITSVKETPMRQMEELWRGNVVGTHPLFGPKMKPGVDLPVAIVRGKKCDDDALNIVTKFYIDIGCRVFECSAEQHDQAMARIQNMNFITNLAYFAVLAGQEELLPFLTPSFERRKNASAKMLTEDAEMFAQLFEMNAHSHEAVRQYRKMLNIAASGDIELLCKRAKWWWPMQKGKNEKQ